MENTTKTRLFASLALLLAGGSATANDWYVTGDLGFVTLGDQDLEFQDGSNAPATQQSAKFSGSFTGGGRVGRYVGDNWRVEGEVIYRTSDLDAVTIDGLGTASGGDFASVSYGLSALYEFNLLGSERYRTYVGAGLAFIQEVDIDFDIDGAEISFETDNVAPQLQAGIRYDAGERWFVDVGIRYLLGSGITLERPDNSGQTITADYDPLSVSLGVGFRF